MELYRQNKFIELLPNTETYKNSYLCRTVNDWNALLSETVNIYSPQMDLKRSYFSILVNDKFQYCIIIDAMIFLTILSFVGDFLIAIINF